MSSSATICCGRACRCARPGGADHRVGLRDVEHDDRDTAFLGERGSRRVHDAEPLFEQVAVGQLVVLLRTAHDLRIRVIDAVDPVLSHEDRIGVDLRRAKGGRRIAREEGVARARGEDHDGPLLELMDRAPADVGLGDLRDRDRGLHSHRHPYRLELGLQRERVDDHGEHPHVVARRLFDAVLGDRRATDDVAAADDHGHLNAEITHLPDLLGEIARVFGRDAEFLVSEQCLARELQHHPPVLGLRLDGHRRQSRSVRRLTGRARTS